MGLENGILLKFIVYYMYIYYKWKWYVCMRIKLFYVYLEIVRERFWVILN